MKRRPYFLLTFCTLTLLLSLAGSWLAPYAPDEIIDISFAPVSPRHWLGTDYLGADVLSRVLHGGRDLVLSGALVVALAWVLAGSAGMLAALAGGWRDKLALTFADMLQSVPGLLLVLLLVLLSNSQGYAVAIVSAVFICGADIIRLARSATLQAMQHDYIDIARLRGESTGWILRHEVAPGLLPLVIADLGVRFIGAVFLVASVSFLGLGAPPPQADWGLMVMENRDGLALQPLAVLAPVLALLLLLVPLSSLADSLARVPARRRVRTQAAPARLPVTKGLRVTDFGLCVNGKPLLSRISFSLQPGEIIALVGASGAGKTTLLHALAGDLPLACGQISGTIELAGQSLLHLSSRQCRRLRRQWIGYLPQDPRVALLPLQRIDKLLHRRAVSLGIARHKISGLISQLCRAVSLPDDRAFLRRLPHQLSGGQRQRVLLALALMGDPGLLLLDEPASAQDSVNTRMLYQHVQRLARERDMAVVLIAHDLQAIRQIAGQIMLLAHGEIQEITPAEIFYREAQSAPGRELVQASQWAIAAPVAPQPLASQSVTAKPLTPVSVVPQSVTAKPITPAPAAPAAPHAGLQVSQLGACHARHTVLDNITFQVSPGACLSIVGASGCGKTTLLRCLLGLHPASGAISWQNQPLAFRLSARDSHTRRLIQYVPQNPYDSLNPYQRVGQLLARPLALFAPRLTAGQRREQIRQTLASVGLDADTVLVKVRQLSGGQRQRLALARALLARPAILLCDEMTSALDIVNCQALIKLLADLRDEYGLTLIMVTHDINLAAQCAGDILVMDQGRIIEYGNAAQIIHAPRQPLTRSLLQWQMPVGQNPV